MSRTLLDMPATRGSITERHEHADGRTRHRVRVPIAGKRTSIGDYLDRAEAEAVLAAAVAEVGPERPYTVRDWGRQWLDRRETDGVHRQVSIERSMWRRHVEGSFLADLPLRRVKRTDVVRWLRALTRTEAVVSSPTGLVPSGRRLSRSLCHSTLCLLRVALRDAADEGHIEANPAHDVHLPREVRHHEGWTWLRQAELDEALALASAGAQRSALTVAAHVGLRAGELWGLRWSDVDLDRREVVVRRSYRGPTKAGQVRTVPLLGPALAALVAWHRERPGIGEAVVWPSATGGVHHKGFDAGWERLRARLDIGRRVRLHDLRHTCASHLLQGTWTARPLRLEEVRQWLGHCSISVTERYAHLCPDALRVHASDLGALVADQTGTRGPDRKKKPE